MTLYAWHVHHKTLFESLAEPIENRILYIKQIKAQDETLEQIATRLRLLKPITGPEIEEYDRIERAALAEYDRAMHAALAEYTRVVRAAWADYDRVYRAAWADYDRVQRDARAEYDCVERDALADYDRVQRDARAEYDCVERDARAKIEALHAMQCPNCPWDGTTIFPRK